MFNDWYNLGHEYTHLGLLDQTPAKDLARTYLARSYAQIAGLMYVPRPSDAEIATAQDELEECTGLLDRIWQSVSLVEELLAAALVAESAREESARGRMWESYREQAASLRREALDTEAEAFPEFRRYFPVVSRLASLIRGASEESSRLRSWAIPWLQPVRACEESHYELDTKEHLDVVIQLLEADVGVPHMLTRLRVEVDRLTQEWSRLLAGQLGTLGDRRDPRTLGERFQRECLSALWIVSHGRPPDGTRDDPKLVTKDVMERLKKAEPASSYFVMVHPTLPNGLLGHMFSFDGREGQAPLPEALGTVTALESLRQQILEGRGFVCPAGAPAGLYCRCSEELNEGSPA